MRTRYSIIIILCLLLGGIMIVPSSAQEEMTEEAVEEIISPFMDLKYLKDTDDQKILNARLYFYNDIGEVALPGITVKFYTSMEDPVLLGEAVTDDSGFAGFAIPGDANLPVNEEGMWWFYAESDGTDKVEMTMAEATVMDVNLSLEVSESEDEGRIVKIEAFRIEEGEKIPVAGEDIYLFVPRMFNLFLVAEGYLEDDGTIVFEFTEDIPGDAEGNLTILARFNDHWQFGNVEKRAVTSWGIPSSFDGAATHRALWTQVAPWWMIITLTILLAGVWGHYLFAIISIFRIWKEGKKLKKEAAG